MLVSIKNNNNNNNNRGTVDLVGPGGMARQVHQTLAAGNVFGFVDSQLGKSRSQTAVICGASADGLDDDSGSFETTTGGGVGGAGAGGRGGCGGATVAAISMASLERMSGDHPRIAIKLMKVLLRQSSLELSSI